MEKEGMRKDGGRRGRFAGGSRRRGFAAGALVLLLALPGCGRHSGPFGHGGWGRSGAPPTEEQVRERLERAADRLLAKVDASDAQREQIREIADLFAREVASFHADRDDLRNRFLFALEAETIDPGQVERIRNGATDLAAKAVGRSIDTAFRAASALTPEQRKRLVQEWRTKR